MSSVWMIQIGTIWVFVFFETSWVGYESFLLKDFLFIIEVKSWTELRELHSFAESWSVHLL